MSSPRTVVRRWGNFTVLLVLTSANSLAANWSVSTDITAREIYTDNASLTTAEPRKADFITELTPGITVDGVGPRLNATLRYSPSAIYYARGNGRSQLVNRLTGFGRLEAIENFFFVDAIGNIQQNFLSPFAARPGEDVTATPNRLETRTLGVSPFVRGQVRGAVAYELRNRNTWTTTDNPTVRKVHTTQWRGRIAGPVQLFGWAFEFEDDKIRNQQDLVSRPDQKATLYRGRLYFQPDAGLRLFVSGGREENNYAQQQQKRSYKIYGAGANWRPSPRTEADVEWEHRFFGPAPQARFTHRTRLTAWEASYTRSWTTFQQELLGLRPGDTAALLDSIFAARIADPVQRRTAVEEFMRTTGTPPLLTESLAFFTEQIYLREKLEGSVAFVGARNSVTLSAFAGNRKTLTVDGPAVPEDLFFASRRIRLRGFGAQAAHRLTPFTSVRASGTRTFSRREDPVGPDVRNDFLTLLATHTLSPKTVTFGGLSSSRFASADPAFARQSANAVFVGLHHRF